RSPFRAEIVRRTPAMMSERANLVAEKILLGNSDQHWMPIFLYRSEQERACKQKCETTISTTEFVRQSRSGPQGENLDVRNSAVNNVISTLTVSSSAHIVPDSATLKSDLKA